MIDLLEKLKNIKVVCVGDIMLDRFIYGDITRISPEAPVPVLKFREEQRTLGGVGNVARNLKAIQAMPVLITVAGHDQTAATIEAMLTANQIEHVILHDDCPTPVKVRHIAGKQQVLRLDTEDTRTINEKLCHQLLQTVVTAMEGAGALLLSDYGKGSLPTALCQDLIALAKEQNIPVFVDPKDIDYSHYAGADYITPNKKELAEASNMPVETDAEVTAAVRSLLHKHNLKGIIATRSEKGMSVVTKDTAKHVPTQALEVYDVSGAGDTVIATLAACVAAGADLLAAAQLANLAAGIVVGKLGTAVALPSEIRRAARRQNNKFQQKVVELSTAVEAVEQWRNSGFKVGFTNGCFDILHTGHITYLADARSRCDRLVVGLNTDSSIKRLKGESRPINNTEARATILAALEMVDMVIPFGEDTPIDLIKAVMPDVLVKGADYTVEQVVGAPEVMKAGGEVYLSPVVEGFSTTGTIARMKET